MKRNFRISHGVEFSGDFGILDVHNAFDLQDCEISAASREVRLNFVANEHRLSNVPEFFTVTFSGLSAIRTNLAAAGADDFVVEAIGFKRPGDDDLSWLLEEEQLDGTEDFLLVMIDQSHIRISASEARVEFPES